MTWVSIITPLYNGIEFLEQCAMSVCLQNSKNEYTSFTWDWWIGVNGHGDGGQVLERAKDIASRCSKYIDCKINVVNLPYAVGKAEALNALVRKSVGEWIAVLDCDDTWERNKLLFQKLAVDRMPGLAVLGTYCKYFGDIVSNGPTLPAGFISKEIVIKSNPLINSSVIIRREYAYWIDRFGLDDYDLWLRLAKQGLKIFNIPYYLVHHRLHGGSVFNGKGGQDVNGLLNYHLK
jgi:glycosyltransferase involved in cell wall biosynthesis